MKDRQQKRVYAWEDTWAESSESTLTLQQARNYIVNACARYGFKAPAVRQHHTDEVSYSWSGPGPHISLRARNHKNPFIALHEASHMIADQMFDGDLYEPHGSEWFGVYLALLEDSATAPRVALHETAKKFGLEWLSYRQISAKSLKSKSSSARKRRGRVGSRLS